MCVPWGGSSLWSDYLPRAVVSLCSWAFSWCEKGQASSPWSLCALTFPPRLLHACIILCPIMVARQIYYHHCWSEPSHHGRPSHCPIPFIVSFQVWAWWGIVPWESRWWVTAYVPYYWPTVFFKPAPTLWLHSLYSGVNGSLLLESHCSMCGLDCGLEACLGRVPCEPLHCVAGRVGIWAGGRLEWAFPSGPTTSSDVVCAEWEELLTGSGSYIVDRHCLEPVLSASQPQYDVGRGGVKSLSPWACQPVLLAPLPAQSRLLVWALLLMVWQWQTVVTPWPDLPDTTIVVRKEGKPLTLLCACDGLSCVSVTLFPLLFPMPGWLLEAGGEERWRQCVTLFQEMGRWVGSPLSSLCRLQPFWW